VAFLQLETAVMVVVLLLLVLASAQQLLLVQQHLTRMQAKVWWLVSHVAVMRSCAGFYNVCVQRLLLAGCVRGLVLIPALCTTLVTSNMHSLPSCQFAASFSGLAPTGWHRTACALCCTHGNNLCMV
jgi:hypothetical protein